MFFEDKAGFLAGRKAFSLNSLLSRLCIVRVDGADIVGGNSARIFAAEVVGFITHARRIFRSVAGDVTRGRPLRVRDTKLPVSRYLFIVKFTHCFETPSCLPTSISVIPD